MAPRKSVLLPELDVPSMDFENTYVVRNWMPADRRFSYRNWSAW